MNLDVYLTLSGAAVPQTGSGIFICENGANVEISREEWNARYPDREPVAVMRAEETETVYDANITHNLNTMAGEAGIYAHLWRPDEIGITKAAQLIEPLRRGLVLLNTDPERFKLFNPNNGWGNYDGLCNFVARYLAACEAYPDAEVSVSR